MSRAETASAAGSAAAGEDAADDLRSLARRIVERARERGATAAEAVLREGRELSATVRLGEIEALKEAAGKGLGMRVFRGGRAASTFTSDFSWPAVDAMIAAALAMAEASSEDPFAGLPAAEELGAAEGDLEIYSPAAARVGADEAVSLARRCEAAALAADARLSNSEGGNFEASEGRKVFANSLGFVGEYRRSSCSLSATPIAAEDGRMQRDYWFSRAHDPAGLESPEAIGRVAAARALRRLGARKVATVRAPVVFEPLAAASLLDHIFSVVSGEAIYRGASFLAGKLGETIAAAGVTVVDDGLRRGGFGSAPFDGEGARKRRTVVIENGRFASYLLNAYTGRKLGLSTTGNAARGLAGTPGVGFGNLYLEPGREAPAAIMAGIKSGLYLTEFLGGGVNPVTGDYSRGASGLWIENGDLAYPVEEITIAGNLKDMLRNIVAIGNDLVYRSAAAAPTVCIDALTIAGA